MRIFKKCLFIILLCILASILSPQEAYSWRLPWRRPGVRPARPVTPAPKVRPKKYRYIKAHDFNADGRVDLKDRLIWLNNNKGSYATVYVSEDNEDIYELMDADGDGDVEPEEMELFYKKYDLNENGVLEEEEIEAAIE